MRITPTQHRHSLPLRQILTHSTIRPDLHPIPNKTGRENIGGGAKGREAPKMLHVVLENVFATTLMK